MARRISPDRARRKRDGKATCHKAKGQVLPREAFRGRRNRLRVSRFLPGVVVGSLTAAGSTPPRPARLPGRGLCSAASTPRLRSPDPRTLPVFLPGRAKRFQLHLGLMPPQNLRALITPCCIHRVTSAKGNSSRTAQSTSRSLPASTEEVKPEHE